MVQNVQFKGVDMNSKEFKTENGDVKYTISAWNKRFGEAYNEWGGSIERVRKHTHTLFFISWDTWDREDPPFAIGVTYSNADGSTNGPLQPNHTEVGYAENKQWEFFVGSRTGSTVVSDIVGVRVDFEWNGKADYVIDGTDWVGRFGWDVLVILVVILIIVIVAALI